MSSVHVCVCVCNLRWWLLQQESQCLWVQVFNLREVHSEEKVHNHTDCEHSHLVINTACDYVQAEMCSVHL